MSGEGYEGLNNSAYLSATRTAHMAKGTWNVRILVYPRLRARGARPVLWILY